MFVPEVYTMTACTQAQGRSLAERHHVLDLQELLQDVETA
jgi:hypothetical protein